MTIIPFNSACLCVSCRAISDSRNDTCPACGETGSLLNLARVLNPTPELGQITFLLTTK